MAWWNFRRARPNRTIETKAALGMGDELKQFLLYGAKDNATNPRSALNLYEDSTAVSIPVNKVSEAFANLDPVLEIGDDKITDHPMLDLLRRPAPEFSQELFFNSLAIYYLVTGEAYSMYFGNPNRPPLEVYPINPGFINHSETNGFIREFEVTGDILVGEFMEDDGKYLSNDMRQLGQIRNFSTKDNSMLRGRSKLIPASNSARQQVLGTKHNLSVLENGGRLSLVFHFENELDDDEFDAVKERVVSQFGGYEHAGAIGVTAGGRLNIQEAGMSNQDMDWLNAQKISNETLALTYNVPLPILSTDASTYNNYDAALGAFYDDAVIPLSKVIYGALARDLFPRFKIKGNAKLTFDQDKVSALVYRRNEEIKLRKDLAIESDNELRGLLGREPYEGGDIMYKPSTLIPVGTDIVTDDGMDDLVSD